MQLYYVYVYEFSGIVRYIGEGYKNRIHDHPKQVAKFVAAIKHGDEPRMNKFYTNYLGALLKGIAPRYYKIAENLTKPEAIARQDMEIAC